MPPALIYPLAPTSDSALPTAQLLPPFEAPSTGLSFVPEALEPLAAGPRSLEPLQAEPVASPADLPVQALPESSAARGEDATERVPVLQGLERLADEPAPPAGPSRAWDGTGGQAGPAVAVGELEPSSSGLAASPAMTASFAVAVPAAFLGPNGPDWVTVAGLGTLALAAVAGLALLAFDRLGLRPLRALDSAGLRRELLEGSPSRRGRALTVLEERGELAAALPELRALARDPDQRESLRARAMGALGDLADRETLGWMLEEAAGNAELNRGAMLDAQVDALLRSGREDELGRLARSVEAETVALIRSGWRTKKPLLNAVLERYSEAWFQDDEERGEDDRQVLRSVESLAGMVRNPNAFTVVDHYVMGAREDDEARAPEDVLDDETPAGVHSRIIDEIDPAEFRKLFAGRFKGHPDLLEEAAADPERRLPILYSLGMTPNQVSDALGLEREEAGGGEGPFGPLMRVLLLLLFFGWPLLAGAWQFLKNLFN